MAPNRLSCPQRPGLTRLSRPRSVPFSAAAAAAAAAAAVVVVAVVAAAAVAVAASDRL